VTTRAVQDIEHGVPERSRSPVYAFGAEQSSAYDALVVGTACHDSRAQAPLGWLPSTESICNITPVHGSHVRFAELELKVRSVWLMVGLSFGPCSHA
jgi:hypothetical protein